MSSNYSIKCHNCEEKVNGWTTTIQYVLQPDIVTEGGQTVKLSCGCTVDFPDWKFNLLTGYCQLLDFYGTLFIEFTDKEMIMEDED